MTKYSIVVVITMMMALPAGVSGIETSFSIGQHPVIISGTVLYVGGVGPGNYTTIQQAVDNASDGDTVFVFDDASPYYEHVRINTSLQLLGENKSTTVIDGGDYGDVVTINKSGVTVAGFTLRRNDWYDDGIVLHASQVIIQDNRIVNCRYAVNADHVDNITITKNEFSENNMGISIYNSGGDHISGNTLNDTYLLGIDLGKSIGGSIIEGNLIIATTDDTIAPSYVGIRLWETCHATISNNTMVSLLDTCYGGLELTTSNDNTIHHNTFIKNGITLYQSYHNVISETNIVNGKPFVFLTGETDKTVVDAGQVFLFQCQRITVKNLVLSNLDAGITLLNSTGCTIQGNTLSLCRQGIFLQNSKRNTISGNVIMNCTEAIDTMQGVANVISNNTIQNSTYYGFVLNERSSAVSGNIILDNPIGIIVAGRRNNEISGNVFKHNLVGVSLIGTSHNTIEKNNFLHNTNDSFFDNAVRNRWDQNYWGEPLSKPKVIHGYLITWEGYAPWPGGYHVIRIPWVNIDWHPAQTPYDM
ncbi:MAG TPA: NosD domain-containing protein [Candidatus Thermoplasmatota archaeon]|nr:NosD domain-containing protein [Candidatus Thermoplasmatota archaeon]